MIQAFHAKLAEVLAAREVLALAKVYLGGEHIAQHDKPPRVVIVPSGGPGSMSHTGPGSRASNPRSLRTRNVKLVIHCWGADFDGAESLLNEVVSAIHSCMVGAYDFEGEEWPEGNADSAALGRVVYAHVTIRTPITDRAKGEVIVQRTAGVTETDPAVDLADDAGDES